MTNPIQTAVPSTKHFPAGLRSMGFPKIETEPPFSAVAAEQLADIQAPNIDKAQEQRLLEFVSSWNGHDGVSVAVSLLDAQALEGDGTCVVPATLIEQSCFESMEGVVGRMLEASFDAAWRDTSKPGVIQAVNQKKIQKVDASGVYPLIREKDGCVWIGVNPFDKQGELLQSGDMGGRLDSCIEVINSFLPKDSEQRIRPSQVRVLVLAPDQFERLKEMALDAEKLRAHCQILNADTEARKAFHTLLAEAVKPRNGVGKATDIHIEPYKGAYRVRFRIDGELQEKFAGLSVENAKKLIGFIKGKAKGLNVAESRRSQDGAIAFSPTDLEEYPYLKGYSLRVSTLLVQTGLVAEAEAAESNALNVRPSQKQQQKNNSTQDESDMISGSEKVALRLLDARGGADLTIEKMGYSADQIEMINRETRSTKGVVLVTGPTGSGKSTTLYAMLRQMNKPDVNIQTIENPVEIRIDGINQASVDPKIDNTFASAMRTFLRQDPDIIMVGEIRDRETAQVAFEAANTGHVVLSTLHTNDAISTLLRLRDLGLEHFEIGQSLNAIIAQRLVRKLCQKCAETYDARDQLNEMLKENLIEHPVMLKRPPAKRAACPCCAGKGYDGRVAIAEVWQIGQAERDLVNKDVRDYGEYFKIAIAKGYKPLVLSGIEQALNGTTSLSELLNVANLVEFEERRDLIKAFLEKNCQQG